MIGIIGKRGCRMAIVGGLLLLCAGNAHAQNAGNARRGDSWKSEVVPDELLVKYKDVSYGGGPGTAASVKSIGDLLNKYSLRARAAMTRFGVQRVAVIDRNVGERTSKPGGNKDAAASAAGRATQQDRCIIIQDVNERLKCRVDEALRRLASDPKVDFVERNRTVRLVQRAASLPPAPAGISNSQWGLDRIGVEKAWLRTRGLRDVIVAVLDTGVDYNNDDLKDNIWRNPDQNAPDKRGKNFCKRTLRYDPNDPMDDNGHGTEVAGIVAATARSARRLAGVAPEIQILPVKFLCSDKYGTLADALEAIQYAIGKGAHILNNSWEVDEYSPSIEAAFKAAQSREILVVAAAGNSQTDIGNTPWYPAAYRLDNLLSVAATDKDDHLADFSNWGIRSVEIAAPGVGIVSTARASQDPEPDDGTSFAAPFVSGCAALLRSVGMTTGAKEVKGKLMTTADKVQGLSTQIVAGNLLNCGNALTP